MGSLPPPSPEAVAKHIEALDLTQRTEWMKSFLSNLSPEAGLTASSYLNETKRAESQSVEVLDAQNARVRLPITHHFVGNAV